MTEVELGNSLPKVHKVTKPYMNDSGLWTHFDVAYQGSFCMTLETKLNLMRLKKRHPSSDGSGEEMKETSVHEENDGAVKKDRGMSLRLVYYPCFLQDLFWY